MAGRKRFHKDLRTKDPLWKAHLTWTEHDGKKHIPVSGYLIDATFGIRLDDSPQIKRIADIGDDIGVVCDEITNELYRRYNAKKAPKEIKEKVEEKTETMIEAAFRDLEESGIHIENWRYETTQHDNMVYFNKNILPYIRDCTVPEDFGRQELSGLRLDLIEKRKKNGNTKDQSENADIAAADKKFEMAQSIYNGMRSLHPELPDLVFNRDIGKRFNIQREQIKTLTCEQHSMFRESVEADVMLKPKYVRAAAVMDSAGLRAAEASAVIIQVIDDYGDFMCVWVLNQEINGKINPIPKSHHAYRMVVLDEWGTWIVRECNKLIGEDDDVLAPVNSEQLSSYVRQKLEAAGCSFEKYAFMNGLDPQKVAEVDAHSLRRFRTNIWRNCCGFIQWELDCMLGHVNSVEKFHRGNPKAEETIFRWAKMISRYDINPDRSNHPMHNPIAVDQCGEYKIIPFNTIRLKNKSGEKVSIELELQSAEMGEFIKIIYNANDEVKLKPDSVFSNNKRRFVEIIGSGGGVDI